MGVFLPSAQPRVGIWHVAQASLVLLESFTSKNNSLPKEALSEVYLLVSGNFIAGKLDISLNSTFSGVPRSNSGFGHSEEGLL